MTTLTLRGQIEALTPIQHGGDEKTGSVPVLRAIQIWDQRAGQHVRLPFVSGNAIRGMLRRLCMHDLVARLGMDMTTKLYHALFTGGILESTAGEAGGEIDLALRRVIRDTLPPLALFGTAIGNQIIQSSLKVDHAMPVCSEYADYLEPGHPALNDPRIRHSVRTFTDVSFATRRDDLRAEREDEEQARQMLIEFEAFVPGTLFVHGFTLVYPGEIEVACLGHVLELWREQPYLAGKSSSGYGRVRFAYEPDLDATPYLDFVAEHRDDMVVVLQTLAERLQ